MAADGIGGGGDGATGDGEGAGSAGAANDAALGSSGAALALSNNAIGGEAGRRGGVRGAAATAAGKMAANVLLDEDENEDEDDDEAGVWLSSCSRRIASAATLATRARSRFSTSLAKRCLSSTESDAAHICSTLLAREFCPRSSLLVPLWQCSIHVISSASSAALMTYARSAVLISKQ